MSMKALYSISMTGIAVFAVLAGAAAGQTVVTGTGNPDIDIAAVQSAVDRGGPIMLRGHFSFKNPPTMHGSLDGLMAVVLISKQAIISGIGDEHGRMTTIDG